MRSTTILAIVAIVVALGAATSLIPIHQTSAQAQGPPPSFPGSDQGATHNQAPFGTCPPDRSIPTCKP